MLCIVCLCQRLSFTGAASHHFVQAETDRALTEASSAQSQVLAAEAAASTAAQELAVSAVGVLSIRVHGVS